MMNKKLIMMLLCLLSLGFLASCKKKCHTCEPCNYDTEWQEEESNTIHKI